MRTRVLLVSAKAILLSFAARWIASLALTTALMGSREAQIRSIFLTILRLTIFWRCGFTRFSSRRGLEALRRLTNRQWFWPRIGLPKGLAMLIRSEMYGVHGKSAVAAGPEVIPAASLPTLLLGGLLLLICP